MVRTSGEEVEAYSMYLPFMNPRPRSWAENAEMNKKSELNRGGAGEAKYQRNYRAHSPSWLCTTNWC